MVQIIGEYGEGPGQFLGSGFFDFFPKADSILVRDNTGRITVLGPDLRFARRGREVGFGLSAQLVHLSHGAFLQIRQRGIELRSLDQSLDPGWGAYSWDVTDVLPVGASESPGSFWVSKGDEPHLHRFNGDGIVQESFRPEGTRFVVAEPQPGLMSEVFQMQFHDDLLWIWMNVVDPELVATRSPSEPYSRPILEIVDPGARRVLASIDLDPDRYFRGFVRGDTAVFVGQNDFGFQTTEFVVAKLVGR